MDDTTFLPEIDNLGLSAHIVAAYVSNNSIPVAELATLIANVHAALAGLTGAASVETQTTAKMTPAQVKKSITPDALISFEDGRPYKTLRRHLTIRGLTPEEYRAKHGLPADYPMTSASYSARRSELARTSGLGRTDRTDSPSESGEDGQPSDEAASVKRRGRPPGKPKASEVA